jgi:phosphoglycerol transferase MdoB-like AlkP superfamily enzyme
MAARNREAVAHLPLSDPCKAYIACNIELDKALEYLLRRLEEAGIAGNTLIVLSSDHYPYGLIRDGFDGISEFLGRPVERNFELFKNNLIIYSEGMEPMTVDKFSSSLDIIPTVSNLLGLEFDSRLLMGQDIFSDSEPLVVFNNRSFITGKGFSVRGRDFTPHPGIEVEDGYREYINSVIEAMFTASARMLDFDYYRKVFQ